MSLSTRFLNKTDQLYINAENIEPIEGYQDIVVHGDKIGFVYKDADGIESTVSVKEFADILKSSPVYNGGPIRLISCETGAEDAITAQYLANYLGEEVMAPTDIVWVYQDGEMVIGPDAFTILVRVKYLRQRSDNMIVIGKVCEIYKDNKYPSIQDLINKPIKEKEKVIEYMKNSKIEAASPAIITDLIDNKNKINELCMMTDGEYGWRSDVIYHVEKYDMELPEEFIQHVLSKL